VSSSAAVWRCAARRTFKEQKVVCGPPPRETGDAWRNERGKTGVRRRGWRSYGEAPNPLRGGIHRCSFQVRHRETKKRPRRDLTGAAFCGMVWTTSAPLWPAWRVALCRCCNHRRGRFYLERCNSEYTPKGAICQARPYAVPAPVLRPSAPLRPAPCDLRVRARNASRNLTQRHKNTKKAPVSRYLWVSEKHCTTWFQGR